MDTVQTKAIVLEEEMVVDRIRAAVDARTDPNFVIAARTDALAVEVPEAARRAQAYVDAGADMLFPEAITELVSMYRQFPPTWRRCRSANITEFGATSAVYRRVAQRTRGDGAYPLSAFRASEPRRRKSLYRAAP